MHAPLRGLPSMVKGAALRSLSRRGSQVQILAHAFLSLAQGFPLPRKGEPASRLPPSRLEMGGRRPFGLPPHSVKYKRPHSVLCDAADQDQFGRMVPARETIRPDRTGKSRPRVCGRCLLLWSTGVRIRVESPGDQSDATVLEDA